MQKHIFALVLALLGFGAASHAQSLVTPPTGATPSTYYLTAYSYAHSTNRTYDIRIVRDGADVYIQGLYEQLPEAWVKGSVDHALTSAGLETWRFPSDQYMGEVDPAKVDDSHERFGVYMYCSTDLNASRDLEIEYNPANDTFEAYYQYLLFSEEGELRSRFEHLQNVTFFSGCKNAITAPADLQTQPYLLEAYECSEGKNLKYNVELGIDGNRMYVKGISEAFPEAWIVGDIVGSKVYFMRNQYLGVYSLQAKDFDIWFTGINHDEAYFTSVVFDYNPSTGILIQNDGNWLVINGDAVEWKWLNNMSDVMLSPSDEGDNPQDRYALVTPPDGLSAVPFEVSGYDYSFGAPDALASYSVEVGFADGEVYLQGLFSDIPDAWIKGRQVDNALVFDAPQYVGKWFGAMDCWMMGVDAADEVAAVTFVYDAAQGAYVQTSPEYIYFNDEYDTPSPMALQMLGGLVLKGQLPDGVRSALANHSATPLYNISGRRVPSPRGLTITSQRKFFVR